jgi:hypothetical protein
LDSGKVRTAVNIYLKPLPFESVKLNPDKTGDFVILQDFEIAGTFPVAFSGDAVLGFVIRGIQNGL